MHTSPKRPEQRRPLGLESLEVRSLMAGDIQAILADDVLRIEGTSGADEIRISQDGGQISIDGVLIESGGSNLFSVAATSIHRISIDALAGNDEIWVNGGSGDLAPALEILGSEGADYLHSLDAVFEAGLSAGVQKLLQFNGNTYCVTTDGHLLQNGDELSFSGVVLSGAMISVGDTGLLIDGLANIPVIGLVELQGGFDTSGNAALSTEALQSAELFGGMVKLSGLQVTLTSAGVIAHAHADIASIGQAEVELVKGFDGGYQLEGTGGVKLGPLSYNAIHFTIGDADVAFNVPVPTIGDIAVRGAYDAGGHWLIQGTYPKTVFFGSIPFHNLTVGISDESFSVGADFGLGEDYQGAGSLLDDILDAQIRGELFYDGRFKLEGDVQALTLGSFSVGKGKVVISNDPEVTGLADKTIQMTVDATVGIPSGPGIDLHGILDGNGNYDLKGDDEFNLGGITLQETHFTLKKGEGFHLASDWNYGIFDAHLEGEITSGGKVTIDGNATTKKIGDLDLGSLELHGEAEHGKFSLASTAKTVSIGSFHLGDSTVSITNRTPSGAIASTVEGAVNIPNVLKVNLTGEVDTAGHYKLSSHDALKVAGLTLSETNITLENGKGLEIDGRLNLFVFDAHVKGSVASNGRVTFSGTDSNGAKLGGFSLGTMSATGVLDPATGVNSVEFKTQAKLGFATVNLSGKTSGNLHGGWANPSLTGSAAITGDLAKLFTGNAQFTMTASSASFSGSLKLPYNLGSLSISGSANANGTVRIGNVTLNPTSISTLDLLHAVRGSGASPANALMYLWNLRQSMSDVRTVLNDFSASDLLSALKGALPKLGPDWVGDAIYTQSWDRMITALSEFSYGDVGDILDTYDTSRVISTLNAAMSRIGPSWVGNALWNMSGWDKPIAALKGMSIGSVADVLDSYDTSKVTSTLNAAMSRIGPSWVGNALWNMSGWDKPIAAMKGMSIGSVADVLDSYDTSKVTSTLNAAMSRIGASWVGNALWNMSGWDKPIAALKGMSIGSVADVLDSYDTSKVTSTLNAAMSRIGASWVGNALWNMSGWDKPIAALKGMSIGSVADILESYDVGKITSTMNAAMSRAGASWVGNALWNMSGWDKMIGAMNGMSLGNVVSVLRTYSSSRMLDTVNHMSGSRKVDVMRSLGLNSGVGVSASAGPVSVNVSTSGGSISVGGYTARW
jgi:hypothetical protein